MNVIRRRPGSPQLATADVGEGEAPLTPTPQEYVQDTGVDGGLRRHDEKGRGATDCDVMSMALRE